MAVYLFSKPKRIDDHLPREHVVRMAIIDYLFRVQNEFSEDISRICHRLRQCGFYKWEILPAIGSGVEMGLFKKFGDDVVVFCLKDVKNAAINKVNNGVNVEAASAVWNDINLAHIKREEETFDE
jgi:hypothetical protein